MLRRVLTVAAIYVVIIIGLVVFMNNIEKRNLIMGPLSFGFGAFMLFQLYNHFFVGKDKYIKTLNYENISETNLSEKKSISKRPFLFGFEKKIIDDKTFFFDYNYFYAVDNNSQNTAYKLTDITSFNRTGTIISNRKIYEIKIKQQNAAELSFKFAPNYSLFNKNFQQFHDRMLQVNPNAVKWNWSFLSV